MTKFPNWIAAGIAAACMLVAPRMYAETATLLQRELLHGEPYIDAPETGAVDKDVQVEVLQRRGNWALVRAGPRQGWVRSLNLRSFDTAKSALTAPAGLLALDNGRSGSRELIATTGIRNAGKPAIKALHDIYNYRDDQRHVDLSMTKASLKIGRDKIELTLRSREAGYVYLLMVGSDHRKFDLLFPNGIDPNNRIEAGEVLKLPRSTWPLIAHGPAGADTLLAIVADAPRDYAQAGLRAAGPFLSIDATADAAKALATASTSAGKGENAGCAGESSAGASGAQKLCSNAFGAAVMSVDEIR